MIHAGRPDALLHDADTDDDAGTRPACTTTGAPSPLSPSPLPPRWGPHPTSPNLTPPPGKRNAGSCRLLWVWGKGRGGSRSRLFLQTGCPAAEAAILGPTPLRWGPAGPAVELTSCSHDDDDAVDGTPFRDAPR